MNIHEIFEQYKDKRETIWAVYMDLFEQCNEIRRQRDFAMTLIKFIDMKNAMDTPTGTFEEVVRLMDQKDQQKQKEFEVAQTRYLDANVGAYLGRENEDKVY